MPSVTRGLLYDGLISWKITPTGSASLTGTVTGFAYTYGGSLTGYFCPNYDDMNLACELKVYKSKPPSPATETTVIEFTVPEMGISYLATDVTWSLEVEAVFDITLFEEDTAQTKLIVNDIKIYNGATLVHTFAGATLNSIIVGPLGIQIFGVMPLLSAIITTGPIPPPGGTTPTTYSIDGEATATGGVKWKPRGASSYYEQSVLISGTDSGIIAPTGSSSGNLTAYATESYGGSPTGGYSNIEQGAVYVWPNQKDIIKINDDYEALWFIWAYPQSTDELITRLGTPYDLPPPGDPPTYVETSTVTEILAATTQFLERSTPTSTIIEDILLRNVSAPFYQNKLSETWGTTLASLYRDGRSKTYPYTVTGSGGANYVASHAVTLARLWGTWFNPFWSVGLWFPPDDADDTVRWPMDGISPSPIEDWLSIGQQWINHPDLPVEDNTRHRVSVVTEPLSQNGLTGAAKDWIGLPGFLGVARPMVYSEAIPTSKSTEGTSDARFTFPGGTGTVDGSGIHLLTGTEINFAWIDFTCAPYGYPAGANSFSLTWNVTNISNLKVYAVGADSSEVLLSDNVSGVIQVIQGDSTSWASSTAHDFGASVLADTYVGVAGSDVSAATISSEFRTTTFSLLPGFAPDHLKIVVTKIVPANPADIDHITFYRSSPADQKVFHTVRRHNEILSKDGPALRYGPEGFFDYGGDAIVSTPIPETQIGLAMTLGDMLAWANCFLLGKDAQDSLATLIGNYYHAQEWGILKDLWHELGGGITTHSFVVQGETLPSFWMINSYREVPPLAAFPQALRTFEDNWTASETYGQYVYSLVQSKHPIIVPGAIQPQLKKDGVNTLTFASAPHGWVVGTFLGAVDNTEGYTWEFWWDDVHWYDERPWRGSFNVLGLGSTNEVRGVFNLTTRDGRFLVSYADSAGAKVNWFEYLLPNSATDKVTIDTGADYYQCRVYDDNRLRIYAVISKSDGTGYRSYSDDGAKTWSSLSSIGISNPWWVDGSGSDGGDCIEAAFVYDSGTSGPGKIKTQFKGAGSSAFGSVLACNDSSGADISFYPTSFHIRFSKEDNARVILTALIYGETSLSTWWSTDISSGATFTRHI